MNKWLKENMVNLLVGLCVVFYTLYMVYITVPEVQRLVICDYCYECNYSCNYTGDISGTCEGMKDFCEATTLNTKVLT